MITEKRLKEVLWLDEDEGRFYWIVRIKGLRIGQQAGSFDAHGYGQVKVDGALYKEHRLVWLYVTGEWPKDQIDHENHMRRDNRFENLREVDNIANHLNRPMQASNTSGFVGVHFEPKHNRFVAYIAVDRKRINLGRFKTFDEAVCARRAANEKYGYHPNHGVGHGIPRKPAMSSLRGRPAHKQNLQQNKREGA